MKKGIRIMNIIVISAIVGGIMGAYLISKKSNNKNK